MPSRRGEYWNASSPQSFAPTYTATAASLEDDEEATLRTLLAYRRTFDALIEQRHGRFVNSAGDSVLAEFARVVEAVNCAAEVQAALRGESAHLPPARQMEFRKTNPLSPFRWLLPIPSWAATRMREPRQRNLCASVRSFLWRSLSRQRGKWIGMAPEGSGCSLICARRG
jgi:hypothetical protein